MPWREVWKVIEVYRKTVPLGTKLPGVAVCPSNLLRKEEPGLGASRPESTFWISPLHLWFCFFTNKIFIIIMSALVVKMKGNIEEKCLSHYKVLYKSLFTFFWVIYLGFYISAFYTDSFRILYFYIPAQNNLFVEPVRYSQKPPRSQVNCQVSRPKHGLTQNPLMGHWEMWAQHCVVTPRDDAGLKSPRLVHWDAHWNIWLTGGRDWILNLWK